MGYTPRLHLNVVAELPGNGKFYTGGGTRRYAPVEAMLHPDEGDRCLSGTLHTGDKNRKSNLSGLDPRTARWLAKV